VNWLNIKSKVIDYIQWNNASFSSFSYFDVKTVSMLLILLRKRKDVLTPGLDVDEKIFISGVILHNQQELIKVRTKNHCVNCAKASPYSISRVFLNFFFLSKLVD